jgi:hypothetical protein
MSREPQGPIDLAAENARLRRDIAGLSCFDEARIQVSHGG